MKRVKINGRLVGEEKPCFVIAEAGINHNGDIGLAKRLVDVAKETGADAVKFQTFKAEELVSRPKGLKKSWWHCRILSIGGIQTRSFYRKIGT